LVGNFDAMKRSSSRDNHSKMPSRRVPVPTDSQIPK
jgi:hypothetical protein